MGRLTQWEGRDQDGPRAVLIRRDHFPTALQEALRKLARYEDMEEEDAEQLHQEDDEIIRHHTEEGRDENESQ